MPVLNSSAPRTVLITGAAIGIGRATALAFARGGDHVVVTDVLAEEGEATAAAIRSAGGSAEFALLDVRSTERAVSVVRGIEESRGALDVVVANAGIAHKVPLDKLDDEKWDHTFDIDLKGMFKVIRPGLDRMRARRSGSIICISSVMGSAYGWDQHIHYSSAKAGVLGLVRGLSVELARDGIRVNGIAPGYIRTAQILSEEHSLGPVAAEASAAFIPMGRLGQPDDIADVIVFLASEGARYITGQTVVVDGGLTVGRY